MDTNYSKTINCLEWIYDTFGGFFNPYQKAGKKSNYFIKLKKVWLMVNDNISLKNKNQAILFNKYLDFLEETGKIDKYKKMYKEIYIISLTGNTSLEDIEDKTNYTRSHIKDIINTCNKHYHLFTLFQYVSKSRRKQIPKYTLPWYGFCSEDINLDDIVIKLDLFNI